VRLELVYGLNVKPIYGHYTPVENLDERFDKNFLLKKQFQVPPPMKDGKTDFAAMKREMPTKMKWKDSAGRQMPDFDAAAGVNISQRAKQVIESLEPGVHEFSPVEYTYSRGGRTETRYWFKVGNSIDSIDRERTNMVLMDGHQWTSPKNLQRRGEPIPPHIDLEKESRLVFNLAQIGDNHMWRDPYVSISGVFFSKRMAQAFQEAGLTGLELKEAEAV
jgi:hypothetical protein